MRKFVSREKLGKKARKELDRQRRVTWDFSPVTKAVESKKIYSRKRKTWQRNDGGPGFPFFGRFVLDLPICPAV